MATGISKNTNNQLRFRVERWDDCYVYGTIVADGDYEVRVCYYQDNSYSHHPADESADRSYLRSLFFPGAQLNLIHSQTDHDGTLFPELIIFEPDYLVDISAVAACIESYGDTPLTYLLNKLRPHPNTDAILLGNLASQFLDEALHNDDCSYADSVRRFFSQNAISVLTATGQGIGNNASEGSQPTLGAKFHQQAKAQREHIRRAIQTDLPACISSFRPQNVVVEPSFFSEMFGLQGRMDFLQLDHRLLIEQKAGKCGFPQRDPDTPTQQDKHYVQMLLYMLLLRYNYQQNDDTSRLPHNADGNELRAYLLYSRYRNSLLELSWAPHLIRRAMRLRNQIVWSELQYAQGRLDFLTTLTADDLNLRHTASRLWTNYQRPAIEALLHPIRQASPLELSYFQRMLQFVSREHLLSKMGNQTADGTGFASIWLSTLTEKLQNGNIITGKGKATTDASSFILHSTFQQNNFRPGDIIILYPFRPDTEPDACQTMVLRGSIEAMTNTEVTIVLHNAQVEGRFFQQHADDDWAVEHDFYESSVSGLYRGLYAFLSAPQPRRDLLLLQRQPTTDTSRQLKGDYGRFNDLVLRTQQARDLFLIIGPPGTGKTSFGLLHTLTEELLQPDSSVLLLSFTNRAVDEICSKLTEQGIDFLRIGSRLSCAPAYHSQLLETKVGSCANVQQLHQLVTSTRVFVGTTTAFNAQIPLFSIKTFSLAIIDEASQILEPHLIGLLSATSPDGSPAIRRFVLIGDHKQLPAVVQQSAEQSQVNQPELRNILLTDCRLSLFERLLRRYRHDPAVTYMLTRQGRMHPDVADFPNKAFYQHALLPVPLPHQQEPTQPDDHRMAFYAVKPTEANALSDKVNLSEAKAIAALAHRIIRQAGSQFDPEKTLGIIVPYRNQVAAIRQELTLLENTGPVSGGLPAENSIPFAATIVIDTVERFQGSQRDFIIYGFTVSQPYQLDFLSSQTFEEDGHLIDRKLNVAMTRARRYLYLVGNPTILRQSPVFAQLLDYCHSRHCYTSWDSQSE